MSIAKGSFDKSKWIDAFKHAAIQYHQGRFWCNEELEEVGMKRGFELIRELDATGPDARAMLIPLLDDKNDDVRVIAAGFLLKERADLALPVLRQIDQENIDEPAMTAWHFLQRYNKNSFLGEEE